MGNMFFDNIKLLYIFGYIFVPCKLVYFGVGIIHGDEISHGDDIFYSRRPTVVLSEHDSTLNTSTVTSQSIMTSLQSADRDVTVYSDVTICRLQYIITIKICQKPFDFKNLLIRTHDKIIIIYRKFIK